MQAIKPGIPSAALLLGSQTEAPRSDAVLHQQALS